MYSHHGYRNNNNNRGGPAGGPYNGGGMFILGSGLNKYNKISVMQGFMMDPYASPFGYGALQGYQYMQQQPLHYPQYGNSGGFPTATNSISPQLQPQQYNGYMMYPPPSTATTNQPQFFDNNAMTSTPISPSPQQQQQQQQTIITPPAHLLSPSNNNNENLS